MQVATFAEKTGRSVLCCVLRFANFLKVGKSLAKHKRIITGLARRIIFSFQHGHKRKVAHFLLAYIAFIVLDDAHHFLLTIFPHRHYHNAAGLQLVYQLRWYEWRSAGDDDLIKWRVGRKPLKAIAIKPLDIRIFFEEEKLAGEVIQFFLPLYGEQAHTQFGEHT